MRAKKTKSKLPHLNTHADLILKNIDEVIYYVTIGEKGEKEIVFLSDKIIDVLGISKNKYLALGKKIIDYCHPEDIPEIIQQTTIVLKKKVKGTFRYRFYNKQKKSYIWIEETIYPQLDKRKKLIGYFGVSRNIESLIKHEQKLSDSEKKFRELAENSSDIIFHFQFKPTPGYTYVSPSVKNILGYTPQNFYSDPLIGYKIIHDDDKAQLLNSQQNIINKKSIKKTFEKLAARYTAKNGKTVWLENRYSPVYKGKEIIALHCVSRDVTEQKLQEIELSQKWLNYHNLINSIPSGIFIHIQGKILFGNKAAYKIAGLNEKTYNQKITLVDLIVPEERPIALSRIKRSMGGEDLSAVDYNIIDGKGIKKVVRVKSSPMMFNGIMGSQIIILDVTLERKLEEERIKTKIAEQVNKELQNEVTLRVQSEEKLKAIFNSSSHLIWTLGKNLEITSFNEQYAKTVKEQCGIELKNNATITKFKTFFTKQEYARFKNKYLEAFKGKNQQFEIKFKSVDGVERYREIFLHPIRLNGKVAEVAAIAQDITDRRNYEKQIIEQSFKLKAIFDSGNQRIWTVNKDFILTSFNENFSNAHFRTLGEHPTLNKSALESVKNTEYYSFWKNKYKEILKGKSTEFETTHKTKTGETVYGQVFLHPIFNDKKQVIEIAAISQDITDRKNAEKQIIEQSSRLKAIFESGAQLMWTVNKNIALTSYNKNYYQAIYDMYGVYPELNFDLNKPRKKFATEEYHNFWEGKYHEAFKGKSIEFDTERTTINGEKIYRHIFLHPIYNEKNEVIEVSGIGYDITEEKNAQEEILNKQSQLSAIINNTDDIILSIDKNYNLIEFNEALKQRVKKAYNIDLKQGSSVFDALHTQHHQTMKEIYKRVFKGESVSAVEKFGPNENEYFFETHYNPIKTGEKITGIAIFSTDITEQKRNESEILKSLKEKDILLQEIHHRVKNNLQVISSILNLQTAYLKDRATINILKECQNRIKTMAFIHESLYQNKDFSQINFSEYIVTLVKNLFYSFEANQQKIRANFDVDEILLNLDTSIPCGLIINELVSNALKYAFNDTHEGVVSIQLKKEKDKIKMVVADNGKGIPENINYKNTETLGLQLVVTLTEQINGTISMKRNKGTIFEIIF